MYSEPPARAVTAAARGTSILRVHNSAQSSRSTIITQRIHGSFSRWTSCG
jgi:hypothetical protein